MKSERWQKVKGLFDAVVELSPDERKSFLNQSCGNDVELRREVESLLESSEEAKSFMESPAVAEMADVIEGKSKKLEAGKSFAHYEIINQIGVGGMGEIYLANDKKLERKVAIKILNEKFAKHQSNLERFTKEAKAASALNHPNILVIHEIGESENAHFIVTEFVEGETLRQILNGKNLKVSETLDITIQIANALVAAHIAKIVHRDIKPENIIIRPDGFVKILDFGIAKLVEQKAIGFEDETVNQNETAKGIILGTVNYMSPEQAKGEKIDERTDIFSFGVVLYEMIAGRTPFAGDSTSETFANLINFEPQPLSRFSSNVPDELDQIVAKTLHKNKDKRYQTMKVLLADLKDLRENLVFDEKLERSLPSGENATAKLPMVTVGKINQTSETNNNFIQRIKRDKSLAAVGLAILLISVFSFGYYFWSSGNSTSIPRGKKSLAVLPFINASQDPNAEYLSDGITESVINNLSQISNLTVMSRNSAFRFKNNQADNKSIASQLDVENLITGDIKQVGDKFIINVRLINGNDDSQIWGSQYIKNSGDLIAAQNEIAQSVATNLRLKLSDSEQQRLGKNYTANPEAYQLYLKGRYHYFKLIEPEIRKSIDFYEQAIAVDPNYALAFAGISDAYRTFPLAGWNMASKTAFPLAKAAAKKALEIDPDLAEAHIALGSIEFFFDWDWSESENELKKAIELAPNNSEAHRFYAHMLSNTGRHDEAVAEGKRARELDPFSLITNALEGQFLFYARRDTEAIDQIKKTLEIEPNFWIAHNALGRVYLRQERFEEAIAEFTKAKELSGSIAPIMQLGFSLAKSGRHEQAQATLAELKSLAIQNYVPAYYFAMLYHGLGEREESLNYLEKSFAEREVQLTFLKVDTHWDDLRREPRFQEIMRRVGLDKIPDSIAPNDGVKLYWQMSEAGQIAFIRAYEVRKIPPALGLYQAMIQSEYHDCPIHPHPSGSVGLFQFSRKTKAKYDLTPKGYCNIEKQSDVAARHMSDLISDFGEEKSSWTLALHSFNQGGDLTREQLRQLRGRGNTERSF